MLIRAQVEATSTAAQLVGLGPDDTNACRLRQNERRCRPRLLPCRFVCDCSSEDTARHSDGFGFGGWGRSCADKQGRTHKTTHQESCSHLPLFSPPKLETVFSESHSFNKREKTVYLSGARSKTYSSPGFLYLLNALCLASACSTMGFGYPSFSNSAFPSRWNGAWMAAPLTFLSSGTKWRM